MYVKVPATEFTVEKTWVPTLGLILFVLVLIQTLNGFSLSAVQPSVGSLSAYYGTIQNVPIETSTSGSRRTQLIWGGLGFISLILIWYRYQTARRLVLRSLPFIFVVVWCGISVLWALDSGISFRRFARLFLTIIIALGVASSIDSPRKLLWTIVYVAGALTLLDVIVAFGLPGIGRDYDGNFTGLQSHKNTAGASATLTILAWLSAARWSSNKRERIILFSGIFVFAIFLLGTNSRTAIAIVIITPITVFLLHYLLRNFGLKTLLVFFLFAFFLMVSAPLLILISGADFGEVLALFLPKGDSTLTGRMGTWEFVISEIARHPWLGSGYGSFWNIGENSPVMLRGERIMMLLNHAHNGYLEVILEIGLIGFLIFMTYLFRLVSFSMRALSLDDLTKEQRGLMEFFAFYILSAILYNFTGWTFLSAPSTQWFLLVLFTFWFARLLSPLSVSTGPNTVQ